MRTTLKLDEHGLTVMSADTDFAGFPHVRWEKPLAR